MFISLIQPQDYTQSIDCLKPTSWSWDSRFIHSANLWVDKLTARLDWQFNRLTLSTDNWSEWRNDLTLLSVLYRDSLWAGFSNFTFRPVQNQKLKFKMQLSYLAIGLMLYFIRPTSGNVASKRLYDDLLLGYNRLIRPVVNDSDTLIVQLGLKLTQIIDLVSLWRPSWKSDSFFCVAESQKSDPHDEHLVQTGKTEAEIEHHCN